MFRIKLLFWHVTLFQLIVVSRFCRLDFLGVVKLGLATDVD